jgi:carbon-monoxide dehydrogenase small subunit
MTVFKRLIRVVVNGRERELAVEPRRTLADFLRLDLELTGTHLGCEQGVCGSCTVVLDGAAVRSCLVFAVQAEGSEVLTIEGLDDNGGLSPLQQAMRERHAFQCGFCTPGFLLSIYALLGDGRHRTAADWREELSGNLCRCTGYQSIVEGALRAAELSETTSS